MPIKYPATAIILRITNVKTGQTEYDVSMNQRVDARMYELLNRRKKVKKDLKNILETYSKNDIVIRIVDKKQVENRDEMKNFFADFRLAQLQQANLVK